MTTPEAPKEQPKGWMNKVLTSGKIAGAIVGVFALLALFGIKPPKLIQDPTPTSARLSATLSDLSIEYDIPFNEYITRHGWSLDTYSDEQRQAEGAIVDFKSEITGFADQWCALKWGIYDAATQKRVLVSTEDLEILIKSERETDKASDYIWVAYPDTAGTYFARIEIFDPNGQRLDFADTELFDLTIDD